MGYALALYSWSKNVDIIGGTKALRELGIHEYDAAFITNKCCGCDLKQCKDANQQELDHN